MSAPTPEIIEAVSFIQRNLHESLSLNVIAKHVGYSPYHFVRKFKNEIGISPLYYVSALRLDKAKRLLVHTNLGVRDIGLEIGQQSLGTFTTRFTERVGVSPGRFRESLANAEGHLQALQRLQKWPSTRAAAPPTNSVSGTVTAGSPFSGVVLVGLFSKPIPEGLPRYGTLLFGSDDFCFLNVAPGTYYLLATAVSWGMEGKDFLLPQQTLRGRLKTAIVMRPFAAVEGIRLQLHPPKPDDPPILISLPLLMNNFLLKQRNW